VFGFVFVNSFINFRRKVPRRSGSGEARDLVRLFRAALIRMWLISTRVNKPENVQLWNLVGLIASVVVVEHLLTLILPTL